MKKILGWLLFSYFFTESIASTALEHNCPSIAPLISNEAYYDESAHITDCFYREAHRRDPIFVWICKDSEIQDKAKWSAARKEIWICQTHGHPDRCPFIHYGCYREE